MQFSFDYWDICMDSASDRHMGRAIEGLRERTEYIDMFLFFRHHSIVFCFRCFVYWWKGSVRF